MTGQLSDDGNFMWNGNEWVPVEQQAAPAAPMAAAEPMAAAPMAAAAPMVVSPHTDMGMAAAPAATVMVATSGGSSGGGLDFTRGFSTLKYGLAAFVSSILTMILITIVWGVLFYIVFSSGSLDELKITGTLALVTGTLFTILAFTQVVTLVMGMGIGDGLGKSGLGFVGSWKVAGVAILESAPVLVTAVVLMIIGLQTEGAISGLSIFLSAVIIMLFQMGLLAFMARKVAEDL
ncbi:MAG: hypothetical protein CMA73_03485 [Euryarchaeota archaeon]|nr:hypothetical protein [Euryarchaeota archaeon]|tara:strand:- start:290 stop:991 length:702 start_codon:yes stop_codon:yes gene_type:complete